MRQDVYSSTCISNQNLPSTNFGYIDKYNQNLLYEFCETFLTIIISNFLIDQLEYTQIFFLSFLNALSFGEKNYLAEKLAIDLRWTILFTLRYLKNLKIAKMIFLFYCHSIKISIKFFLYLNFIKLSTSVIIL